MTGEIDRTVDGGNALHARAQQANTVRGVDA